MGLLNYIEDEQPLFGGVLRAGYDPSRAPRSGQGDDIVSRYQPQAPVEASLAGPPRPGLPQAAVPTNQLPVVEVTADRSPPTENQESSLLGVLESLGVGAANTGIGIVSSPHELFGIESWPSARDSQRWVERKIGSEFHKPTGKAEEYAETIGGFLPGLIGGWPGIGARALTRVLAPAIASETAAQYYKGTDKEKLARMAGAFAGAGGAGLAASRLVGLREGIVGALLSNAWQGGKGAWTARGEDTAKRREREAH